MTIPTYKGYNALYYITPPTIESSSINLYSLWELCL